MHRSETLRMLGPLRYQLAGALTLLQGKTYSIRLSYLPAPDVRSVSAVQLTDLARTPRCAALLTSECP